MLKRLVNWLAGVKPEPVEDIGTGSVDIYTMDLDAILRRMAANINPDTFLIGDDEDDTANFDYMMDELGGEG